MTDEEILTMAGRHHVSDPFDMRPRDEEVLAFARELAAALMAERDKPAPLAPPGLDWRERPRPVDAASPMSDSDMTPLS